MELNLNALKRMQGKEDNSLLPILKNIPLFEGINDAVLASIASGCQKETYKSGTIIISEWEKNDCRAYIILSGTVAVSIEWTLVSTLSEGMVFGEYAIVCDEKRSATVQAQNHVECLILRESDILRLSDETNKLNEILITRINENTAKNLWIFRE